MDLHEGDAIEVVSNKVDQPSRFGTVRRILDKDPLRIEVEWDDGHTTHWIPDTGTIRVQSGSR
jgi:hypothetical protein